MFTFLYFLDLREYFKQQVRGVRVVRGQFFFFLCQDIDKVVADAVKKAIAENCGKLRKHLTT